MTSRGSRAKPISRVVFFLLLVALPVVLLVGSATTGYALDEVAVDVVGLAAYGSVAGIVIFRRDGHLVGWLLLGLGATVVSLSRLAGFPGIPTWVVNWAAGSGWSFLFALFAALTLVFPSGHLPAGNGLWPRIGRTVAQWLLPLLLVVTSVADATDFAAPDSFGFLPGWVWLTAWFGVLVVLVGGAVSLVVRRRHSSGTERAQLGWVVLPLAILAAAILATGTGVLFLLLTGAPDPGDDFWTPVFLAMLTFPVAFGVAVLRYRLYEIDRIISRTLTYGLVSAVLIGVYLGAVFVLGTLLPLQGELAVAGATLTAAALFNPLRRRIQNAVDRRFNRSRFDTQLTMEALSRRLSNQIDLLALGHELQRVAGDTMQPATVTVWLREKTG